MYVWGDNSECQLGLGDKRHRLVPTPIETMENVNAIEVTASLSFSAILTGTAAAT